MRINLCFALVLSLPAIARAELKPEQIAILAMRNSPQSRELAEHYAKVRRVPATQILLLEATAGETLSRDEWQSSVRPAIRNWIAQNRFQTKLRCLVTVWDVPLKIDKTDPDVEATAARRQYLMQERRNRMSILSRLMTDTDQILPDNNTPIRVPPKPETTTKEALQQFEASLRAAQDRLSAHEKNQQTAQAAGALERVFVAGSGAMTWVRVAEASAQSRKGSLPADAQRRMDFVKGEVQGHRTGLAALEALPESAERDEQIVQLLQRISGVLGTLVYIDGQLEALDKNESYSSFDNELSLIYWPGYPLARWQPNLLYFGFEGAIDRMLRPTLMVARLEAPTFELSRKLVDTAIEVEKTGLTGKVYLDARGIEPAAERRAGENSGDYDQSLRDLEKLLKEHTRLEVVLDNQQELFQPGKCPQAALYCGWYSLGQYVDAFDWRPGSVAFHIASAEASSLRGGDKDYWCKRLLEDGVCATLGPVYEPYLIAYPHPREFFCMLVSGKFTVAEAYHRTLPHTSWVMTFIGDPLYNPYRNHPALDPEKLPDDLKRLFVGAEK